MITFTQENFLSLLRLLMVSVLIIYPLNIIPLKKMLNIQRSALIFLGTSSIRTIGVQYILEYLIGNQFPYYNGIWLILQLLNGILCTWSVCYISASPIIKSLICQNIIDVAMGYTFVLTNGLVNLWTGHEFSERIYPICKTDFLLLIMNYAALWLIMRLFSPLMEKFRKMELKHQRMWIGIFIVYYGMVFLGLFSYGDNFDNSVIMATCISICTAVILYFVMKKERSEAQSDRQRLRMAVFNSESTMYQIEMTMHLQKEIALQLEKVKAASHSCDGESSKVEGVMLSDDTRTGNFCTEKNSAGNDEVKIDVSHISNRLAMYRDSLNRIYAKMKYTVYCRNWHLNALLNYYYFRFREMDVQTDIRFQKYQADAPDSDMIPDSKQIEGALNYLMNAILSEWNRSAYTNVEKSMHIHCETTKGLDILTIRCTLNGRNRLSRRTLKSLLGESMYHLKMEERTDGMEIQLMIQRSEHGDRGES